MEVYNKQYNRIRNSGSLPQFSHKYLISLKLCQWIDWVCSYSFNMMVTPANQFNNNDVTLLCLILNADRNSYLDTKLYYFWNNMQEYGLSVEIMVVIRFLSSLTFRVFRTKSTYPGCWSCGIHGIWSVCFRHWVVGHKTWLGSSALSSLCSPLASTPQQGGKKRGANHNMN